jgi:microcephalin
LYVCRILQATNTAEGPSQQNDSPSITPVVSGTVKGCWVLSVDWIFKSLEAGQWLPEGAFELITEFPSAQFFRLEKQQAGLSYKPALFNGAGIIYVSPDTNPSHDELKRLLTLSGARSQNKPNKLSKRVLRRGRLIPFKMAVRMINRLMVIIWLPMA